MRTFLALSLLVVSAPAHADEIAGDVKKPAPASSAIDRGDFYMGFGLGLGSSNLAREAIAGSGAASLGFRAGGVIAHRLMIGPEILLTGQYNKWEADQPTAGALSSVLLEVMGFPLANVPLNVSAGAGWGSGLAVNRLPDNLKGDSRALAEGSNGLAWMGALGWDFFAGRGWNLGLQVRYDGASLPDLRTVHGGGLALWLNSY